MAQPPPETLPLAGRRVAFTTPQTGGAGYGDRLGALLRQRGARPVPVPTIAVQPHEPDRLRPFLLPGALDPFAALAFTSRSGISAFARALPPSSSYSHHRPLSDASASALPFTVAALGSDADLLDRAFLSRLCSDPGTRVAVLVPGVPTPAGLVEALGPGSGRRVLCPVPDVVGLREPPVVPDFLAGLEAAGWVAVRAPAYTTCWAGPGCAEALVGPDAAAFDAIVFTSTAEVEGLLKGLDAAGWTCARLRARWPGMVVAAHGPVTAAGARSLGVEVDVVSARFSSFHGVVDALATTFSPQTTV
jgi:uroporphyrinogen-III synthase